MDRLFDSLVTRLSSLRRCPCSSPIVIFVMVRTDSAEVSRLELCQGVLAPLRTRVDHRRRRCAFAFSGIPGMVQSGPADEVSSGASRPLEGLALHGCVYSTTCACQRALNGISPPYSNIFFALLFFGPIGSFSRPSGDSNPRGGTQRGRSGGPLPCPYADAAQPGGGSPTLWHASRKLTRHPHVVRREVTDPRRVAGGELVQAGDPVSRR